MELVRLGEELSKEAFVSLYMKKLREKLLRGYKISVREEKILETEKVSCELFYFSFHKQHKRGPDVGTLEEELTNAFLRRVLPSFGLSKIKMDENQFVMAHIHQIKQLSDMKLEFHFPDGFQVIIQSEEKKALEYFRKEDSYSLEYEHLLISRSSEAVSMGLTILLRQFIDTYHSYYRQYRKTEKM